MVSFAESVTRRSWLRYNQKAAAITANSAAVANRLRKRRRGDADTTTFSVVGNRAAGASGPEVSVARARSAGGFVISGSSGTTVTRAVNWYPFRAIVTISRV